jgi:hypothetical protein
MDKPQLEALKEAGRLVLIALVSYLATAGTLELLLTGLVDTKWIPQITLLLMTILRWLDKLMHETSKVEMAKPKSEVTEPSGLVPF